MLTLIEGGDLYAPEHLGHQSILLVDGKIGRIGAIDRGAVEAIGIEVDVIDANGCIICPGFIDPHEHLLGGSGEEGFATQSLEIHLSEIVRAGITTVVGTLGVDTTMKTMAGLLAKAKALKEERITAHIRCASSRISFDNGGDPSKLTVSSDASIKGPDTFFGQIRALARSHRLPLAKLLALVTRNTAEVLKLEHKGRLEVGADGDILVIERDNFELVDVLARSKRMVTDGQVAVREQFLEKSNRRIALRGGEELDLSGITDINANQEPLEAGAPA